MLIIKKIIIANKKIVMAMIIALLYFMVAVTINLILNLTLSIEEPVYSIMLSIPIVGSCLIFMSYRYSSYYYNHILYANNYDDEQIVAQEKNSTEISVAKIQESEKQENDNLSNICSLYTTLKEASGKENVLSSLEVEDLHEKIYTLFLTVRDILLKTEIVLEYAKKNYDIKVKEMN